MDELTTLIEFLVKAFAYVLALAFWVPFGIYIVIPAIFLCSVCIPVAIIPTVFGKNRILVNKVNGWLRYSIKLYPNGFETIHEAVWSSEEPLGTEEDNNFDWVGKFLQSVSIGVAYFVIASLFWISLASFFG